MRRILALVASLGLMTTTACKTTARRTGDPIPNLRLTEDPAAAQSNQPWGSGIIDLSKSVLQVDLGQRAESTPRAGQANLPYCINIESEDMVLGEAKCVDDNTTFLIKAKNVRLLCGADPAMTIDPREAPTSCTKVTATHYVFNYDVNFTVSP